MFRFNFTVALLNEKDEEGNDLPMRRVGISVEATSLTAAMNELRKEHDVDPDDDVTISCFQILA